MAMEDSTNQDMQDLTKALLCLKDTVIKYGVEPVKSVSSVMSSRGSKVEFKALQDPNAEFNQKVSQKVQFGDVNKSISKQL